MAEAVDKVKAAISAFRYAQKLLQKDGWCKGPLREGQKWSVRAALQQSCADNRESFHRMVDAFERLAINGFPLDGWADSRRSFGEILDGFDKAISWAEKGQGMKNRLAPWPKYAPRAEAPLPPPPTPAVVREPEVRAERAEPPAAPAKDEQTLSLFG